MDVVIGYGAHPQPAEQAIEAIKIAREKRAPELGEVTFIAAVCGTLQDYQDMTLQKNILKEARIMLLANNREVVESALSVINAKPASDTKVAGIPTSALIQDGPKVINIGLASFAEDLRKANAEVVQVNWAPPAGGDEVLIKALDQLV
jgi:FdrA protein